MNLNPNEWSCTPTAFANVLQMDVGTFIVLIGHEGRERGFHTQECIEVLESMGVRAVTIDLFPKSCPTPDSEPVDIYMGDPKERLERHMGDTDGVLLGTIKKENRLIGHAVSWYKGMIYDPRGVGLTWAAQDILYKHFDPRQFVKVYRCI